MEWIAEAPPCQNCGGELTATSGQTILWTTTFRLTEDGYEVLGSDSGWCGACIEEWNQRMGFTAA